MSSRAIWPEYGFRFRATHVVAIVFAIIVAVVLVVQLFSVNHFPVDTDTHSSLSGRLRDSLGRSALTSRHIHVKVTSSQTNITLTLLGACRTPFTYAGTDTRVSLLTDFDVIGIPAKKYSPPVMNWAKVLLLQSLHTLCMNTSTWLVCSDVDAYIVSRRRTASRLRRIPESVHYVFMNGVWYINIGFLAFRTTSKARELMDAWGSKYVHPPKTFFDARIFGRGIVEKHRSSCADKPNGFLGWHLKGSAKWKASLAYIGRRYMNGNGDILAFCISGLFVVLALACVFASRKRSEQNPSISTRPHVLHRLTSYSWRFASTMTHPVTVVVLAFVAVVFWSILPQGNHMQGKDVSKRNLSHALFDGRVMLDHSLMCANGEAYSCTKLYGWRALLWKAILSKETVCKMAFAISAIVEWSGVTTLYALAVAARLIASSGRRLRARLGTKSQ